MNKCDKDFMNFQGSELSYIGQDCFSVPKILGNIYGNQTRRLDMSFNSLRSLDGLELFPLLEELVLDNNNLDDQACFIPLKNLHTLSLNKNFFVDIEKLLNQLLQCFPNLSYLSLLGNPACPDQLSNSEKDEDDYMKYRVYVLHYIPNLKFLDSTPVNKFERLESEQKGYFFKVIKPKSEKNEESNLNSDSGSFSPYTPLPSNSRQEGNHRGSFGKLRQHYAGTQSEGNRFIRDSEL